MCRNSWRSATVMSPEEVVVNDVVAVAVEGAGEHLLGQRHADRVGDALTERTGGGFHARSDADFRVARRLAVQLAELFKLIHRQVVARQVQQGVNQHRAVAVGEHEAIATNPFWVLWVMDHMLLK